MIKERKKRKINNEVKDYFCEYKITKITNTRFCVVHYDIPIHYKPKILSIQKMNINEIKQIIKKKMK